MADEKSIKNILFVHQKPDTNNLTPNPLPRLKSRFWLLVRAASLVIGHGLTKNQLRTYYLYTKNQIPITWHQTRCPDLKPDFGCWSEQRVLVIGHGLTKNQLRHIICTPETIYQ